MMHQLGSPSAAMRISSRTKVVVTVLLVFLTGWNLYANSKQPRDRNVADRTVLFITAPIQKALTWCVTTTVGVGEGYFALVGVNKENARLTEQLDGWEMLEARSRELELENDRLRELAGLRERLPPGTVAAEVIGWGTSSRYRVVRIDRGRAHGVEPGHAVVGVHGAVGQVLHTSAGAADVLLLSDSSSNVASRFQDARLRGIVQGNGRWGATLEYVARQDADMVMTGDLLVTSGDDGVFPPGVPVGVIGAVEVEETGHFLSVEVEPAEALASIEEVVVLVERPAEYPSTPQELMGPVDPDVPPALPGEGGP